MTEARQQFEKRFAAMKARMKTEATAAILKAFAKVAETQVELTADDIAREMEGLPEGWAQRYCAGVFRTLKARRVISLTNRFVRSSRDSSALPVWKIHFSPEKAFPVFGVKKPCTNKNARA
jgi:hypothetical protein